MYNLNEIIKLILGDMKVSKIKRYRDLYNNVEKICREISDLKNIDISDMDLYNASMEIYYNSIWFSDIYGLCRDLCFIDSETIKNIDNQEFARMERNYNELVEEINCYKEFQNIIQEEGFLNLENEYMTKLKELFCKMLDYKNRKYDKEKEVVELLEDIDLCYFDYDYLWTPLYQLLNGKRIFRDTVRDEFWTINADDVEYLYEMRKIYNFFTKDEDRYKNYNQLYDDIILKENQIIEDLYAEEKAKLNELYIEMLNFKNIKFEKDDDKKLESLVEKNYPEFLDSFIRLEASEIDVHNSYIDMIHTIRSTYEYFKKTYKNK